MTPRDHHRGRAGAARGFTLLEVIIAIAILGVSLAVLAEVSRLSLLSARRAALQTEASLVAESVLAELESGAVELVELAGEWNPTETQTPEWRYETFVEPSQMQGMLMVRVVVAEIDPGDEAPTTFQLVRWLPDPEYLELIQSQSEEAL